MMQLMRGGRPPGGTPVPRSTQPPRTGRRPAGGAWCGRAGTARDGAASLAGTVELLQHGDGPSARGPDGVRVSLFETAPAAAPAGAGAALPPQRRDPEPLLKQEERFEQAFHIGEVLGHGTYGAVRACTHRETGQHYAVKILQRRRNKFDRTELIRQEVAMAQRLSWCRSVVRTHAVYLDGYSAFVVQDLLAGGTLQALADSQPGGRLPEAEAAAAMRGVLDALAACFAEGIVYGDVKPANFVLSSLYPSVEHLADPSAPKGRLDAIMVDFGCARPCAGDGGLQGLSGTPAYVAPEVAAGEPYGPASDLWGAGVLAYQLLTGRFPFWDIGAEQLGSMPTRKVLDDVSGGAVLLDTPSCRALSPESRDLLAGLLERSPARRISAHDALRHPWMQAHGLAPLPAAAH